MDPLPAPPWDPCIRYPHPHGIGVPGMDPLPAPRHPHGIPPRASHAPRSDPSMSHPLNLLENPVAVTRHGVSQSRGTACGRPACPFWPSARPPSRSRLHHHHTAASLHQPIPLHPFTPLHRPFTPALCKSALYTMRRHTRSYRTLSVGRATPLLKSKPVATDFSSLILIPDHGCVLRIVTWRCGQ